MSSNDRGDEPEVADVAPPRSRPGRPAASAQRAKNPGRPAPDRTSAPAAGGVADPLLPIIATPTDPTSQGNTSNGSTSNGSTSNGNRSNRNGSGKPRSAPRPTDSSAILLAPPAVPEPTESVPTNTAPTASVPIESGPADVDVSDPGAALAPAWSFKRLKSALLKPVSVGETGTTEVEPVLPDPGSVRASPITSPIPVQRSVPSSAAPMIAPPMIAPPIVPQTLEPTPLRAPGGPTALMPEHPPYVSPTPVPYDEGLFRGRAMPLDPSLDPDRPQRTPRLKSVHVSSLRRQGRPRLRRVTRIVRHIDPWSVFKVALCFSLVLYGVCLTAGVLLWNVAYTTGTIDNIQRFFESFGWDTFRFKGGELFHNAWIAGLFCAIGLTGLIVLAATLFNLITDLVGGIRITVLEEEVIERDPSVRSSFLRRRSRHTSSTVANHGVERDGRDGFGLDGFGADGFGSDGFGQLG